MKDYILTATENGDLEQVKYWLDRGADVETVNTYRACHTSLLWIAAEKGYTKIAKLLIDAGAKVNLLGDYWLTPLIVATKKGHLNIVKALLEAKANPDIADADGRTALLAAISCEKQLRDNVKMHRNVITYTPMYIDIIKLFIQQGVNLEIGNKEIYDEPPLLSAAFYGLFDIAKLLVNAGANINATDSNGETVLMKTVFAVGQEAEKLKMLQFLLQKGADINAKNNEKVSVLDVAQMSSDTLANYLEEYIQIKEHQKELDDMVQKNNNNDLNTL